MTKLSEKSYLSIGLVISLVGGIAFITKLNFMAESNASLTQKNADTIQEVSDRQTKYMEAISKDLSDMKTDIAIIKLELKRR